MYPALQRVPPPRAPSGAYDAAATAPFPPSPPPAGTFPHAGQGAAGPTPSMMQWSVGPHAGPRRGGVPPSPSASPPCSRSPSRRLGGNGATSDKAASQPLPAPQWSAAPEGAAARGGVAGYQQSATPAYEQRPRHADPRQPVMQAGGERDARQVATPMDRLKSLSHLRRRGNARDADMSTEAASAEAASTARAFVDPPARTAAARRTRALPGQAAACPTRAIDEAGAASMFNNATVGGGTARQHRTWEPPAEPRTRRGASLRHPEVPQAAPGRPSAATASLSLDEMPAVAQAPHADFEAKLAAQLRAEAGSDAASSSGTRTCPTCSRSFNPDAYQKHVGVCKNVFVQKRKAFDSKAARAPEGAEQAGSARAAPKSGSLRRRGGAKGVVNAHDERPALAAGATKGSWKQKSETVRAAMRANKCAPWLAHRGAVAAGGSGMPELLCVCDDSQLHCTL